MVKASLAFGLLEALFDVPATPSRPGQVRSAGPAGPVAGVTGDVSGVGQGAAGQQLVPAPGCHVVVRIGIRAQWNSRRPCAGGASEPRPG